MLMYGGRLPQDLSHLDDYKEGTGALAPLFDPTLSALV